MVRLRDVDRRKLSPHDRMILSRLDHSDGSSVSDTPAELKSNLLSRVAEAIDEKLATMVDGEGLGIVFRLEVISPKRDKQWANFVRERDGACVRCGSVDNLQAHHIKPVSSHPELVDDPDNGETLCAECHATEHPRQAGMILSNSAQSDG